jgi:arsenate reductase-like glutaredoxin family protein
LAYDEYYKLDLLLDKNVDKYSTHEILFEYKQLEQASVEKIISNYAERVEEVNDLYGALLFIEEFHSKLINAIIKDNSLSESSIIADENNKVRISARSEPYKDDSVKIFLLFNDSIRSGDDIFSWRTKSDDEKKNQYIGENLVVSKEHDSIFGESPFYKNDTVYWKPWVISTSVN